MDALLISTTLSPADWQAWQGAWTLRLQARAGTPPRFIAGVIVAIAMLTIAVALLSQAFDEPVPFVALAVGAALAALTLSVATRRLQRVAQPDEDGVVLGPVEYRFDTDGIEVRKRLAMARYRWGAFKDVTLTADHLFVWIDPVAALIIPLRDLPAGVSAQLSAERLRAFAAAGAQQNSPEAFDAAPLTTGPACEPAPTSHASLPAFIGAMARVLILRPTARSRLHLREPAVLALAMSGLAAWLLIDWVQADAQAEFYAFGLVPLAWHAGIVLLVAWLWSRLSAPQPAFRTTLAVAVTLQVVALVLLTALRSYVSDLPWTGVLMVLAAYATLCGAAALRTLTAQPQPRAVLAGLLLLSFAVWFSEQQYVAARFWYPPQAQEDMDSDASAARDEWEKWLQTGDLLFAQADRIDSEIAQLERPAGLASAAFFLGFAGMGEQKVFAEEIALAGEVIGTAFDAGNRSLRLINDQRDLQAHPLASPAALRRALSKIAARMDLERDVLFLALSSHGSQDGELSVSNGAIPVQDLSAAELAEALRTAGIRRRVVIVSACYSGTFIEPLRDENTIVITAAAADRSSFGCSDDRELTYFGEAFYRDALPMSRDLRAAFELAAAAIAQREAREGKKASHPQAHFGTRIEAHLRTLQRGAIEGG